MKKTGVRRTDGRSTDAYYTAVCKCAAYASSRKTTRGLHHVGGEHEHAQTQTRFFAASPSQKKIPPHPMYCVRPHGRTFSD